MHPRLPTEWRLLSLRQKIGQTMIMLPNRKLELELGGGSLETYFERYPISRYFMGWKLFDGVPKDKIIVVSMGSPHLLNEYFERVHTCINAYSYDESTQSAVVRALLGEIPFVGSSPVSLQRQEFNLRNTP
jgi:hypothetical protein